MNRFQHMVRLASTVVAILLAGVAGAFPAGGSPGMEAPPGALLGSGIVIEPRQTAPSEQRQRPTGNPLWAIPLSALSATRERPLFRSSRRPPVVSAARPAERPAQPLMPPAAPESPQLALVGTIVGEVEAIAVFLKESNGNEVVRLRIGEAYEGWRLESVKGREAILQKDGESVVLNLPTPDSVSAGVPSLMNGNPSAPPQSMFPSALATPPIGPQGTVYPRNSGDFAPFVPRSTPKNGEHDGL